MYATRSLALWQRKTFGVSWGMSAEMMQRGAARRWDPELSGADVTALGFPRKLRILVELYWLECSIE